MDLNVIIPYINLWLGLIILPIFSFNLLWRMLPIYLNGFVGSIYLNRPSHTTAVFGGLTALWACADWIRGYMMEQGAVWVLWYYGSNSWVDENWISLWCFRQKNYFNFFCNFFLSYSDRPCCV